MAGIEDKMLNKMESVRQNDHAIRNMLVVGTFLVYLLVLYVTGFFMLMLSFKVEGFGFFRVVWGAFAGVGAAKALFALLTIILLAVETFLFIAFKGIKVDDKLAYEYANNGNYGTSKFLSADLYKEFLELTESSVETDGIILGTDPVTKQVVSIPKSNSLNRNIFICGSQGTSKSIAFSRTMVMQCAMREESVFLTDPKGELYRDLALFLKSMGYKVYQWNLVNRWSSDGWDLLQEVHGDEPYEYIDILVNTIIANTGGEDTGDFFDNIEGMLLKALCLYVLARYPEEEKNFGSVYNLIYLKSSEELDTMFAKLSNATDEEGKQAYGAYNMFAKSQTNKGNAILGLGSRLSMFSGEVVQRMLSHPDIQIEDLGKTKTAIFCIASDSNNTYAVLNSLLTSFTFIKVMAYADRIGGQCKVPVHFILDEFVNIGSLPAFTKKLGTARSRDIGMTIIVQNMAQLENRYPNGQAEEIVGGCDFRILLGANDMETAKYFSALVGVTTIKVNTDRRSTSTNLFSMNTVSEVEGSSEGSGQRSLLLPDEILAMDNDLLLLNVRGKRPIQLVKYKYFYDPNALLLRTCRASDVVPDWTVEDGISLRTGERVTETRAEMEERIMRDPTQFVVRDSVKWGPQRTDLIKTFLKSRKRYRGKERFPNGMEIALFDDFILGGREAEDDSEDAGEPTKGIVFEAGGRFRQRPAKPAIFGNSRKDPVDLKQDETLPDEGVPEWVKNAYGRRGVQQKKEPLSGGMPAPAGRSSTQHPIGGAHSVSGKVPQGQKRNEGSPQAVPAESLKASQRSPARPATAAYGDRHVNSKANPKAASGKPVQASKNRAPAVPGTKVPASCQNLLTDPAKGALNPRPPKQEPEADNRRPKAAAELKVTEEYLDRKNNGGQAKVKKPVKKDLLAGSEPANGSGTGEKKDNDLDFLW